MEWIRQKCWGTKAKKCMLKKLLPYLILSKSWYLYQMATQIDCARVKKKI